MLTLVSLTIFRCRGHTAFLHNTVGYPGDRSLVPLDSTLLRMDMDEYCPSCNRSHYHQFLAHLCSQRGETVSLISQTHDSKMVGIRTSDPHKVEQGSLWVRYHRRVQTTHPPRILTRTRRRTTLVLLVIALFIFAVVASSDNSLRSLLSEPILKYWPLPLFISYAIPGRFSLSALEPMLLSEPNASFIAEWSHYYTSQSSFPGEGKEQALWTQRKWREFGVPETKVISYNASISEPVVQRLALIDTSGTQSPSVVFEAKLMEELPSNDPSEVLTPAFHGQSYSGNVTAQFVYANFGREEDYDDLERSHVNVTGKIAIVKYGANWRGEKLSTAARRGLVGILTYSDPQQDGEITEQNGYKAYPDGPARPESCIERGSIGSIRKLFL